MGEQNILKVNPLPTLTWNHLMLNFANMPLEAASSKKADIPSEFKDIETGMGREFVSFVESHASYVRIIRAGKGEDLGVIKDEKAGIASEIILIEAGEDSRVTFYTHASDSVQDGQITRLVKVIAGPRAQVTVIQSQTVGNGCLVGDDFGAVVGDEAKVRLIQSELGGKAAFAGGCAALKGYKADFTEETIYFGDESRRLDFSYVTRHTGKKTTTSILANGALFGNADKVYRGSMDFIHGCSKSKGREAENVLLFSPTARNRSIPLILCDEEDVDGQHAASIGKINKDLMYYLQSRGLTENQARQLAVESRFNPVIDEIPDEAVREEIHASLERRMNLD
ncbi:MAG: SufD family Fe-S cluster assembly protein [Lachnospiraceae bacterium]|jgi:Fe-S cluster assembly scaffold protein SufB|nr:SufD family Fe-S cluster assembly protein [Lachnospiraceae bacterium]MCH4030370.1 SufD family Fe-S cluster assembly protein [Lachnospiraceae bacterium]MCH4069582.1 SufD family Fe-S cluster assembly protein [Lachnospiraceae bacterium]MCH4107482.1 SufD family Fe-S cluster assembly protein [Lachnospiraceae bacterium]MCI1301667.1 SufD family Fe-S cluster assembly protein [Lachnospiraceae bacterium]